MNVLIVDDDGAIRALVRALLRVEPSCVVSEARDGAEALTAIEQTRPDLVFLDVRMPIMDGLGVLEALRSEPAFSDVAVVMMSAAGEERIVRRAIELGIADHLAKPLTPALAQPRILRALAALAGRPRRRDPALVPVGARDSAVLLVDRDASFRAFFESVFADEMAITSVERSGDALRAYAERRPSLVCLGEGLSMPNERILAHRVRHLDDDGRSAIYLIAMRPRLFLEDEAVFDGAIQRSFVATSFRDDFTRVALAWADPVARLTRLLGDDLRGHLVTATRQALSVVLGQEVAALPPDAAVDAGAAAAVELCSERGETVVTVTMAGARADAAALGDSVDIVAGRVIAFLDHRGITVTPSAPALSDDAGGAPGRDWPLVVPVSTDGNTRFVVGVTVRAGRTALAVQAAATR